ncbi:hypothetical protein [Streptomyces sp. NPDC001889]
MARPSSKKTNSRNEQKLARALRDADGCGYQEALRRVREAARRGPLPSDPAQALAQLTTAPSPGEAQPRPGDQLTLPGVRGRVRGKTGPSAEVALELARRASPGVLADGNVRGGEEKSRHVLKTAPPHMTVPATGPVVLVDHDPQPSLGTWPAPGSAYQPVFLDLLGPATPLPNLSDAEQDEILRQLGFEPGAR